jgi:hypothetical protein
MTDYEKLIYNTFLRVSRTAQNKPFKYRKSFSGFKKTGNYVYVHKLRNFLNTYKHVDLEAFLASPYKIYPDEGYFDLKFYTTQKAIKAYTLYKQKQENADPDSEEQIKYTTDSIYYIYQYCKDNKLDVDKYLAHKTGTTNTFLLHLKENQINIYSLFGFPNFNEISKSVDASVTEFMFPDFYKKIDSFRLKLYNSKKLRDVVKDGHSFVQTALSS